MSLPPHPSPAVTAPLGDEAARVAAEQSFDAVYAETATLLRFIAHVRFGIPLPDAEALVQDVFLQYALQQEAVYSPRQWLVASISNASRNHLRNRSREVPLPEEADGWEDPASAGATDRLLTRLAAGAALKQLGDRCREVLYRFHVEGESTASIASELGTTAGYVQLRLHHCRKRARAAYVELTRVGS